MSFYHKFCFTLLAAIFFKVNGTPMDAGNNRVRRMVGGSAVTIATYPYMASVYYNNYFKCGATIISQSWILTAAYCVVKDLPLVKIRVGSNTHNSGGIVVTASQAIQHELYNFTTFQVDFDIGLYKLTTPLTYSSTIKNISLPTLNMTIPAGTMGTFLGWGNTSPSGSLSVNLLSLSIPTVTLATCNQQYAQYFMTIKDMKLCAGPASTTKTVCQGDQGGPLVAILSGVPRQIAILPSITDPCNPNAFYHVFISVPVLRDWIKTKTGV